MRELMFPRASKTAHLITDERKDVFCIVWISKDSVLASHRFNKQQENSGKFCAKERQKEKEVADHGVVVSSTPCSLITDVLLKTGLDHVSHQFTFSMCLEDDPTYTLSPIFYTFTDFPSCVS